jgi:hypothetical protein
MPRVSVLLPSYNHAQFVADAVASVLGQTLSDLELVIVDDGSSDGSRRILEEFDDPRVVVHLQDNQGAHAALNKALELSEPSSELVAVLNSDDLHEPRWLETAAAALEARPEAGFCAGLVRIFGAGDDLKLDWRRGWYHDALEHFRDSGDLEASLLRANFIMTTSNVVFRRSLSDRIGGFRPLRYVHDLDFFLRLAATSELALVEEELVGYRIHPANTIAEARRERMLLFEFGWILADLLERTRAAIGSEQLQSRFLELLEVLPQPAVGTVALALLLSRGGPDAAEAPHLELALDADHPLHRRLTSADLDPRGAKIQEMENTIAEQARAFDALSCLRNEEVESLNQAVRALEESQRSLQEAIQRMDADNRALDVANHKLIEELRVLGEENERLRSTRGYRLGELLARTHGIKATLKLPIEVVEILRDKQRPPAPDDRGAG